MTPTPLHRPAGVRRVACALILACFVGNMPFSAASEAREAVKLAVYPCLSSDGAFLVFSWRDDIWQYTFSSNRLKRITVHPGRDLRPFLSPDDTRIAFVSNREGSDQIWVMPLAGGAPKRVTRHTESAALYGWYRDGEHVYFRSRRDRHWRHGSRIYRTSVADDAQDAELVFDASARTAAVSSDGKRIAFTREGVGWMRKAYRGPSASQIWIYDTEAKSFAKLSSGSHSELWPCWRGPELLYVSDADGTMNLWSMNADGTNRKQLTHFKDDGVTFPTVSYDGSAVVFRRLFDLYRLPLDKKDATPTRLPIEYVGPPTVEPIERRTLTRASDVAFTNDGLEIATVSGGDLFVMDTELREPVRVTKTPAEEGDPVFSKDLKYLYFTSDAGGQPDIWRAERVDAEKFWWQNESFTVKQITNDTAPEWDLRATPDGEHISYVKTRGDLFLHHIKDDSHKRILESWSDPYYDFSPDGKWLTYAVDDNNFNADVWIKPVDGSKPPVNVSMHPDNDTWPTWSPDGKILAWSGRRWGEERDICYVYLVEKDGEESPRDRKLEKALKAMKARKKGKKNTKPSSKKAGAATSKTSDKEKPATAKSLVGTWTGRVKGPDPIPADGSRLRVTLSMNDMGVLEGTFVVVDQIDEPLKTCEFNKENASLNATADTPLGLLTLQGTLKDGALSGTWSIQDLMDGTFSMTKSSSSNTKDGASNAATDKPESPKAAPSKTDARKPGNDKRASNEPAEEPKAAMKLDLEGIEDRVRRISIPNATETYLTWSHNSKDLAFQATIKGQTGTYKVTFPDKLKPQRIGSERGTHATWIKQGDKICWLQGGQPASLSGKGKSKRYGFRIQASTHWPAVYRAAFHRCWQTIRDQFYDENLNGKDWDAIRAKYAPGLTAVATVGEVDQLINMMLGELNASHMGFRSMVAPRWRAPGWRPITGHLGLEFDATYEGEGVRVSRVIKGSPPDQARSRIEPGEILLSIDDMPVDANTEWTKVLTRDVSKEITLRVKNTKGKIRNVATRLITHGAFRENLYRQWIEDTREAVDKASKGRMGYIHVRSMNWSSFQSFEADLYKAAHGRDGLLIDVRENGGGFTADHLLTCLTQPRHAITVPRGGGPGYPQDRMVYARWDQPVVVLCNQNSFSNAEIFAHAIKTLKRGKVVGVQTAGGVISTGGRRVMGLGSLRIPFRGWYLTESGDDMEMNGCKPDIEIWNTPSDEIAGNDAQLGKAIEALESEIARYKARPKPSLIPKSARSNPSKGSK